MSTTDDNQDPRAALRQAIQNLIAGVEQGETRVSYPDGSSKIFDNFQLLEDDLMQLFDTYVNQRENEAYIKEASHRANDAIERLWRIDRKACVEWLKQQEDFYRLSAPQGTEHE